MINSFVTLLSKWQYYICTGTHALSRSSGQGMGRSEGISLEYPILIKVHVHEVKVSTINHTHAYPSWAALLILQTESLRRFGNLCRQWMCVWQADQRRKTGTLCLLTGESDFLKSEIQESRQWRRGVIVTVPCLTSQHSSPISLQAIQTSRYQCLFQDFYYIIMTDYYAAWL